MQKNSFTKTSFQARTAANEIGAKPTIVSTVGAVVERVGPFPFGMHGPRRPVHFSSDAAFAGIAQNDNGRRSGDIAAYKRTATYKIGASGWPVLVWRDPPPPAPPGV
jgi:hypothetical protein